MAIQKLTWGGADGATATAANTGFGSIPITNAAGVMMFDDVWKPRGAALALLATKETTTGQVFGQLDITPTDVLAYDQPMRVEEALGVTTPVTEEGFIFLGTTANVRQVSIVTTPTGVVRIRDSASVDIWTSAAGVLEVGRPLIVSVYVTRHETAGTIRVVVYEEDGITIRADSGLLTGRATGAAPFSRIRSSGSTIRSTGSTARYLWGEPRWDIAATGLLPPVSAHRPFGMWIGGVYQPVDVKRWTGSGYESVVSL